MTGMEYVWRVRVYDTDYCPAKLITCHTKVFTNKVEALQYAAQLEVKLSSCCKVQVTKWFGDDE